MSGRGPKGPGLSSGPSSPDQACPMRQLPQGKDRKLTFILFFFRCHITLFKQKLLQKPNA